MYIIIGLGNKGEEYKKTRHNIGFIFLDYLQEHISSSEWKLEKSFLATISKGTINSSDVILIKPETFMNLSGQSVKKIISKFPNKKVNPFLNIIVIHDDIDLPNGKIRISINRGSGGHNGVSSIIDTIKSKNIIRIRIGVSPKDGAGTIQKPKSHSLVNQFVLKNFKKEELAEIMRQFPDVCKKIEEMIQ